MIPEQQIQTRTSITRGTLDGNGAGDHNQPASTRLADFRIRRPPVYWIALFTMLSWLGEYVHNRYDLPALGLLSPENSLPALISLALFLGWWQLPRKAFTELALLAWACVQLVGGIVSVLPLSFLPFFPQQTVLHYVMHVVYAAAQVPLIVALVGSRFELRR